MYTLTGAPGKTGTGSVRHDVNDGGADREEHERFPVPRDADVSDSVDSDVSIDVLYRLHGRPLLRYLLRVTLGDLREAEDLLQETMLRAWRYLQDHQLDLVRLRAWLYVVARRAAIDAGRARRARPKEVILTDLGSLPAARDDIERMLVSLTLRRALLSLSPEHRDVLIAVYYRGLTAREAAEMLGIPEGTVKSRTYYAQRALAAAIKPDW
jgi:RNA polymerase sigma-70 factor, ECF subfamily